jgi:hypothetical protein
MASPAANSATRAAHAEPVHPAERVDGFAGQMSSAGQVDGWVNTGKTSGVIESSEQTVIEQLVERLTSRYPAIAQSIVASVVINTHARFDDRPVRDFIPLLVERNAKSELDRLATAGSAMPVP